MDPSTHPSLSEIAGQIPPKPDLSSTNLLERVTAQLQAVDKATAGEHGTEDPAVSRIAHFAGSFLSSLPTSHESDGDKNGTHCRHVSMTALDRLTSASRTLLDDHVVLTVVPYADATSASSTDVLAASASSVLSRQFSQRSRSDFIVSILLETAIRPHLSKWSSTRLTATGRVAAYEDSNKRNMPTDLEATPPWVGKGATMIPLFQWALKESDDSLIESHWPSFTPFLLALLDDTNTSSRIHGLRAAEVFIRKCPARVLAERGIGKVLEEAILPTLQFLPSHTPEAESAQLLDPAYTALVLLARTRFGYDSNLTAKCALLDKLLREIFSAYSHASGYTRIVEALAVKARLIVDELGIYAIKHLKDLIPMFSSVMMDPFLAQHPQCLLAAAEALRSTILNCWPRVLDHYSAEVLRSTIVCWLNIHDSRHENRSAGEERLSETLRDIATLVSKSRGSSDECSLAGLGQTTEEKPELQALFH